MHALIRPHRREQGGGAANVKCLYGIMKVSGSYRYTLSGAAHGCADTS